MQKRPLSLMEAAILLFAVVLPLGLTVCICRGLIAHSADQDEADAAVWERAHEKYQDQSRSAAEREQMFRP